MTSPDAYLEKTGVAAVPPNGHARGKNLYFRTHRDVTLSLIERDRIVLKVCMKNGEGLDRLFLGQFR